MDNNNNTRNYLFDTEIKVYLPNVNREKIAYQIELNQDFWNLIPFNLKSQVVYIVNNEFQGNLKAYRETAPLFEQLFKKNHLLIANNVINKKSDKYRELNKQRKEYLLWACQLLKLVGTGRGGALPFALVNEYKASQEAQEAFAAGHRLVGLNGKTYKISTTKRKQRNAQNYRIAKTFDELAKDKNFTFSFITFTLPPEYHPNPKFGKCSYSGKTPSQAKAKLNNFWELTRANLAKAGFKVGEDFFGMQVNEAHKDSTLHKHLIIYHSKKNTDPIHQIIKDVEHREKQTIAIAQNISIKKVKFRFDIKLNNGKAKASTYLFKYISKSLDDKDTLIIEACRSFYSARAFNHFGLDGKINTFNHLCSNYKNYVNVLNDNLVEVFEKRDLYSFIKNHKDKFNSVLSSDVFLGVAYEESGNIILIEKKQYCLFEFLDNASIKKQEISNAFKIKNSFNLKISYSNLREKADKYIDLVDDFLQDKKTKGFNVVLKDGFSMSSNFYMNRIKELDILEEEFNNSFKNALVMKKTIITKISKAELEEYKNAYFKSFENNRVTVNLHYSSENDFQSFSGAEIPPDGTKKEAIETV